MSKSILVMDTPEVCIDCPCHFTEDTGKVWCGKEQQELLTDDIETFKPDWCPLKELPEKKIETLYLNREDNLRNIETYGEKRDMLAVGWNMCIDKILKDQLLKVKWKNKKNKKIFY